MTISISMGALIFHGKLSSFFHYGIGMSLCTVVVLNIVLVIGSRYPGIVSGPQSASSVIIASGLLILYEKYAYLNSDQGMHLLLLSYIFTTTTITGLFLFLSGKFKLGKMARFVPYPVFGGVLAGTGYLIVKASISFMVGDSDALNSFGEIVSLPMIIKWGPGAFFAIVLFTVSKTKYQLFLVPSLLFLSIPLFYACMWLTSISYGTVTGLGLVLQMEGAVGFSPTDIILNIQKMDFSIIFQQRWTIISIGFISSIALLFNLSSLELILKDDIDFDRELQLSGYGNVISGLCGGIIGYQMLAPSAFNHILGVKHKVSIFIVIAMSLMILLGGNNLLRYFPVPLIGGYLLFVGISFLYDYLYSSWARMPLHDYLVVFIIFIITIFFGLVTGIVFGIVAAVFIFIINYAKVKTIKNIITGEFYRSNVERPQIEEDVLRREGKRIRAFILNGYIFFGSAYSLYMEIKKYVHLLGREDVGFIILDFKDVEGIDSSAIHGFLKIKQIVDNDEKFNLLFTRLNPTILNQFIKESVLTQSNNNVVFTDIDRGFEKCEELILKQDESKIYKDRYFSVVLKSIFQDTDHIKKFKNYLIPRILKTKELLIKKGDNSDTLYFVEAGQCSVQFNENSSKTIRYRKIGSGSIVGEMGFFTNSKRTASVIAIKESKVYELNIINQAKMETEAPEVAFKFQKYVIQLLSKRLSKATQEFNSLFIDKR